MLFCAVTEILAQIPELFRQLPDLIVRGGVNLLLGGKHPVPQEAGSHGSGVPPGDKGTAGAKGGPPRRDAESLAVKPQGVVLPRDLHALAAFSKFLRHEGRGGGSGRPLLEKGHDMLNAVILVASTGEGTANDRRWHQGGCGGCILRNPLTFFCLDLGNRLYLLLHRGEQTEQREVRPRRRRSGGLFARRFTLFLIYL